MIKIKYLLKHKKRIVENLKDFYKKAKTKSALKKLLKAEYKDMKYLLNAAECKSLDDFYINETDIKHHYYKCYIEIQKHLEHISIIQSRLKKVL